MQRCEDVAAVRAVLDNYIRGIMDGDIDKVKNAFHPQAVMHGNMLGFQVSGTPEPFFNDVEHGPSQRSLSHGYQGSVLSIEVYGPMAIAVVAEDRISVGQPDGCRRVLDMVDSFHLIKVDDQWLIVSKLFYHD